MNLGENLNNSFNYAKKLFSDAGRLIILIILDLVPIVNWIVIGYAARILKESPSTDAPPKLENYGELFVNGAKVFLASLIYMIVPTLLIIAGAFSVFTGMVAGEAPTPSMLLGGTGLVFVLVGVILAIVLLILLGVGMAHMIKTGKFGKAFAFSEIFSIIRGIGWGRYVGWIIVVIIIAAIVGGVTGSIPFVGWIISAIISPALSVFIFRSMGLLYNDGVPAELRAQAPASTGLACASCGTSLQPYHKFCPSCGAPAPAPSTQAPTSSTEAGTKFCISCGARIPSSAGFCGSCGAKQT